MTPPPHPEDVPSRITALETLLPLLQQGQADLKQDVKAIPPAVAAQVRQLSESMQAAFRHETRRCRRIQAQRCPAAGKRKPAADKDTPVSWGDTLKQAAVGIGILGAVIGSAYLGAQDSIRPALPTPAAQEQTQQQGGPK